MPEFEVTAKVDIPEGAMIECPVDTYATIIKGYIKGEVVEKDGKFVLQKQTEEGSNKMAEPKEVKKETKRFWAVRCMMCETMVDLPLDDFRIISTDQGAEFIRKPDFICGKCRSVCMVDLKEEGQWQDNGRT